jgi:hypothetical protein
MSNIVSETKALSTDLASPLPIEQPIGALGYAVLGFLNLLVAIAIAVGIFYAGREFTAQPTMRLFNYILLAVLGVTTALFLFGAMRSGAALTSKKLDTSVELGGPVVIAVLVVAGGYYFTKVPDFSSLTFQLPADSAQTSNALSAKLIVDLPGRRETVTFNSNGEGTIREVSYAQVGRLMKIALQSSDYKFENNQNTIDVPIPDNWNVSLKIFQISEEERKQLDLKAIYSQLVSDINLELVRKDAMLFPAIEAYLKKPTESAWQLVKAAAADSERRINASLDKELEIRSESELIDAGRRTVSSINNSPKVRHETQPDTSVLKNVFEAHRQRAQIIANIPKVVLPSHEEVVMWRDEMKIHYLEMKDKVRTMIESPEF